MRKKPNKPHDLHRHIAIFVEFFQKIDPKNGKNQVTSELHWLLEAILAWVMTKCS